MCIQWVGKPRRSKNDTEFDQMDKFLAARQQTNAELTFDVRKRTQADACHRLRSRCIRFSDLIFDFDTHTLRVPYDGKRSVFMQITLCVSRWFDAGNDFGHRSTVLFQLTPTNRSINSPYVFFFNSFVCSFHSHLHAICCDVVCVVDLPPAINSHELNIVLPVLPLWKWNSRFGMRLILTSKFGGDHSDAEILGFLTDFCRMSPFDNTQFGMFCGRL